MPLHLCCSSYTHNVSLCQFFFAPLLCGKIPWSTGCIIDVAVVCNVRNFFPCLPLVDDNGFLKKMGIQGMSKAQLMVQTGIWIGKFWIFWSYMPMWVPMTSIWQLAILVWLLSFVIIWWCNSPVNQAFFHAYQSTAMSFTCFLCFFCKQWGCKQWAVLDLPMTPNFLFVIKSNVSLSLHFVEPAGLSASKQ